MTIKFNPRISGKFVDFVLGDDRVAEQVIKSFGDVFNKEDLHNLTKAILIKGFNCFDCDVNNVINGIKDRAEDGR